MDSISVGAQSRRADGDAVNSHVPTAVEPEMELGAVLDLKSMD